ncbi:MAG: hypothetical protein M3162_02515 [Thermoproteota archaeon]|nr:hypothetical protein [Thermoproteota archaeon]
MTTQSSPYKQFTNIIKLLILQTQYFIHPYYVGKDKKSLAMILPYAPVKSLDINPSNTFFFLKVTGQDEIHLLIVRQEDLKQRVVSSTSDPMAQEEKSQ